MQQQAEHSDDIGERTPEHDALCLWVCNYWKELFYATPRHIRKKLNKEHDVKNVKYSLVMEYPVEVTYGQMFADFVIKTEIDFKGKKKGKTEHIKYINRLIEVKPKIYSVGDTVRQLRKYQEKIKHKQGVAPLCYLIVNKIKPEVAQAIVEQEMSVYIVPNTKEPEYSIYWFNPELKKVVETKHKIKNKLIIDSLESLQSPDFELV